jgi:hypothetical protein
MNPPKKLTSQTQSQESQTSLDRQQTHEPGVLEFPNADALLRHDALHTPVPPRVGMRLQDSIQQIPPPPTSWWRRWFGKPRS